MQDSQPGIPCVADNAAGGHYLLDLDHHWCARRAARGVHALPRVGLPLLAAAGALLLTNAGCNTGFVEVSRAASITKTDGLSAMVLKQRCRLLESFREHAESPNERTDMRIPLTLRLLNVH